MLDEFAACGPAGSLVGTLGGAGRDLLLLHGGPGLSDYTLMLGDEVEGWRAIRYQQRGLPPSTTDPPFTVGQHVADAVGVLDELAVERVVLLGHSWGGYLALELALAAADRIDAVVVVESLGPRGDGGTGGLRRELRRRLSAEHHAQIAELDRRMEQPGSDEGDAVAALQILWPSYFADPATAPPVPADLRVSSRCNSATMIDALQQIGSEVFAHRLRGVQVPLAVLVGGASPMPATAGRQINELVPHSVFVSVPEAGHLPWHERPGCVAEALQAVAGSP